jgi:hypothetical protein
LDDQQKAHTRQWLLDTRKYITIDDRYVGTDNIGNNDQIRSSAIRERLTPAQYTIAVDVCPADHHPRTQIFLRPSSDPSLWPKPTQFPASDVYVQPIHFEIFKSQFLGLARNILLVETAISPEEIADIAEDSYNKETNDDKKKICLSCTWWTNNVSTRICGHCRKALLPIEQLAHQSCRRLSLASA